MGKNIKKYKFSLRLLLPLLLLVLIFGYSYKEKYLNCATKDFVLCLKSNKYVSATGEFSFRYPQDYPLTFKTGNDLINQYRFDDNYSEWVNFSTEFYPNAGGDRLGSIIIEKKTSYQSVKDFGEKTLSDFNKLPERFKGIPPKIEGVKVGGEDAV